MQISIKHDYEQFGSWIKDVNKRHIPFATALAMTMTVKEIKVAEVETMKRVFNRPTPYTLNALRVVGAKRDNLVATVEFKEWGGTPAKRFLNPEISGGERSAKSHERQLRKFMNGAAFAIPATDAVKNSYGNLSGAFFTRVLSQLKASSDPFQNASQSGKSKKKRRSAAFFIPKGKNYVMERKGQVVKPILIFTKAPHYKKLFPFYTVGDEIAKRRIQPNFNIAFERAMATANFKGKWSK